MTSVGEKLNKLREERVAREKARIEMLRELNLKKYNKTEPTQQKYSKSNTSVAKIPVSRDSIVSKNVITKGLVKNNVVNIKNVANQSNIKTSRTNTDSSNLQDKNVKKTNSAPSINNFKHKKEAIPKKMPKLPNKIGTVDIKNEDSISDMNNMKRQTISKSVGPTNNKCKLKNETLNVLKEMSILPRPRFSCATNYSSRTLSINQLPRKSLPSKRSATGGESVFDRLYKPKQVPVKPADIRTKNRTDPKFSKKIIKNTGLKLNKRHTMFDVKQKVEPARRSISAVHLKKISKNELSNCIHKWASIGDNLNEVNLNEINEDHFVKQDKIVSAVKSERKRVKFQTPMPLGLNTPKPEELQSRLKSWLQKRGKSLDSYHHLQCFGIHHLSKNIKQVESPKFELYDDEDKENIALEHDSDNESYTENMNEDHEMNDDSKDRWRRASYMSENYFNDTPSSTVTSIDTLLQVDELLHGALNDLTELLREGFEWEQCARWLRSIRESFPRAPDTAAYWECRAALEETRGDLPASVQCWEEAIAKGTERSIVESNLDQLLDKFMQLKISPNSGKRKPVEDKMVDVKNVFKSTIIRFAVQQTKLRRSSQIEALKYTVTPVRRSSRLSCQWSAKRLHQECLSVRQAKLLAPVEFVPNPSLCRTP